MNYSLMPNSFLKAKFSGYSSLYQRINVILFHVGFIFVFYLLFIVVNLVDFIRICTEIFIERKKDFSTEISPELFRIVSFIKIPKFSIIFSIILMKLQIY